MKITPLLIAGSLVANAALAFALVQRSSAHGGVSIAGTAVSADSAVPKQAAAAQKKDAAIPTPWPQLTAGDLPDVVTRLRAEGFPPKLVRAIVGALVAEHFADRSKAIADAIAAQPWWRANPAAGTSLAEQKITAMRRRLNSDERDMVYQLLGPDTDLSEYERTAAQQRYGNLDPDRIERLNRLNSDYTDLMSDARLEAKNIILPEDREKLGFLEQQKQADLAKLLSPEELFEYNLRSSSIATRLHTQLAAFDPSEDEYRAIFKVQQDFDAQYADGRMAFLTVDERRDRRDALSSVTDQLKDVLSPERFADYQLMTSPSYLQTSQLVTSLSLPATATADIVGVQRDATSRMTAIVADRSLTNAQRGAQLQALAEEASTKLTATLGENGMATYRSSTGVWLSNLEQRAARLQPAARPAPAVKP
ncbi:MAG TPA: hypothetical protein VG838_04545 [Opitutaceae bacterium]|nr:hypothetical protein [Opitutaceae bacterium]